MTTQKRGPEWRYGFVLAALVIAAFMLVSSAAAADTGAKFKGFGGAYPPVANFSANVTSGTAPLTVQLFNNSTTTTPITSYLWTIAQDGRTFTTQNPVVTFASAGTYDVTLRVTNGTDQWASNMSGTTIGTYTMPQIVVTAPTGVPSFGFTPADGALPLDFPIEFKATQTGGQTPTTWTWNWGDGTSTSNGAKVTHTFTGREHADHVVTLTGTNAAGSRTVSHKYTFEDLDAPDAKFSANASSGVAPLAVGFTSSATGNISSYEWNFGGAGTSALKDPEFLFTLPGDYNVTQKVSNAKGSSTAFQWVNLTGPNAPAVLFKAVGSDGTTNWGVPAIGLAPTFSYSSPYTIDFTDYSVNYSQERAPTFGAPTSWHWDFGNGQTSAVRNATVTYAAAGDYTVRLTATNSGGSNSSYVKVSLVAAGVPTAALAINNTPVANLATFPGQILTGETVNFGSISTGNPTSYTWVFSDNPSAIYSTSKNTTKAFSTPGPYLVTFTATNGAGSSTKTGIFTVTSTPSGNSPVAAFFMNNGTQNVTVSADGQTFNPVNQVKPVTLSLKNFSTNAPTSFQWFINGALVSTEPTFQTPPFSTAGVYTIIFRATNAYGTGQRSTTVTVVEPGAIPVAFFTTDPPSGTSAAPATVKFTDTSSNSPTSWSWNFDDSQTSTEQNPSHTFSAPGNYTVRLIATNSKGASVPVSQLYQVKTLEKPEAKFTANTVMSTATEIQGSIPFEVNFTSTSTMNPTAFLWQITGTGVSFTRTTNTFNYTFETPGKYSVQLIAYNAAGQDVVYKSAFVNVTTSAPVSDFTWTPTPPTKNQPVQFTDATLYGPTVWSWSFGDGGLSSAQNPSHTYMSAGAKTVTLTTWNSQGQNTISKVVVVADITRPVANFTYSPENPMVGDLVTFTDSSTNSPTAWTWVIENTQYNIQNPSVTFTTPGTKIAFLIASNAAGASEAKLVQINVAATPVTVTPTPEVPIVAGFTVDKNSGAAPLTVQFVSTSTGPYNSLDWTILVGDEIVDTMIGENPSFTFNTPNTYTVLLEASATSGEVATAEKTITVTAPTTATATPTVTTTTTETPIGGNIPYPSAHNLPGIVQAEDYDVTAGYPAYSDTTLANEGGAYRNDAVDIEVGGSGYNVGWIRAGEFLTYSVDTATAGTFNVNFRVANPGTAKTVFFYVNGAERTLTIPSTGSFGNWQMATLTGISLNAGRNQVRINTGTSASFNFDYMDFQRSTSPTVTTTPTVTTPTTTITQSGSATFTAAPNPVKKSTAIKFTVTPRTGKTIKSVWWTFDKVGHYNTWNSRNTNPTFYYPAVGTFTPIVIITYTDNTIETVEKTGFVRVIA